MVRDDDHRLSVFSQCCPRKNTSVQHERILTANTSKTSDAVFAQELQLHKGFRVEPFLEPTSGVGSCSAFLAIIIIFPGFDRQRVGSLPRCFRVHFVSGSLRCDGQQNNPFTDLSYALICHEIHHI